jgi:hypothetical protein
MGLSSGLTALGNGFESAGAPDQYAHQRKDCGTVDSTCRLCGLTVGRAFREATLIQLEARHVCQLVERRRATRIAYQVFNPPITVA